MFYGVITKMTSENSLLSAAEEIGAEFEGLLERAAVNDSGHARLSFCLCLTIAELYIGALAVLRSRAQSHAPVLVRSMHEALADLRNLVANPAYFDQIRFDNATQMLKTFRGFLSDPDLRNDKEVQQDMGAWLTKEQQVHDELQARGLKSLKQYDKFKQANMTGEYATGYRVLCSFTHSNLTTLLARHGGEDHLRFTHPLPLESFKMILRLAINFYIRTLETLPKYTNLTIKEVQTATDAATLGSRGKLIFVD